LLVIVKLEPPTSGQRGQFTRVPLTPFTCYRAFVQAELIGLSEFAARLQTARLCLYAWDTALLPGSNHRDTKIVEVLTSMQTTAVGDPDFRIWFIDIMKRLIARKRSCFPDVSELVERSELTAQNALEDQLAVSMGGGVEVFTIPVVSLSDAASVPDGLRLLRNNVNDLGCRVSETPASSVTAYDVEQLQLQCGMWRAELDALEHAAWLMHGSQHAPRALAVTATWQRLASELATELKALMVRVARRHRRGLARQ